MATAVSAPRGTVVLSARKVSVPVWGEQSPTVSVLTVHTSAV